MSKTIKIFDTTLRDGEQSPGCSMNLKEKLDVASHLEQLNVDIIEAGFAISSKGDFESIQAISKHVKSPTVCNPVMVVTFGCVAVVKTPETSPVSRVPHVSLLFPILILKSIQFIFFLYLFSVEKYNL